MNVKSFVNGLDPENTVKGYYDENDQLVMVEPEGSGGGGGGGGDFTIATLTVVGAPAGLVQPFEIINVDEEKIYFRLIPDPGTYDIVLYKGSQDVVISSDYDVTGSAAPESEGDDIYIVTGDFTITYNGGGE